MELREIQEKVHTATAQCWDERSSIGDLAQIYGGGFNVHGDLEITKIARQEFLSKIGVPLTHHGSPFFDRLSTETQKAVVMDAARPRWTDEVLTRWFGETLRAVVSEHYACVPHAAVVDVLAGFPLAVRSFYPPEFTAETKTMHIRLTTDICHTFDQGDDGFTMLHVVNSEVGMAALTVDVGIFREVCTNGLLARIGGAVVLQERHIYHDPEDLLDVFQTAVFQAEEVAYEFMALLQRAREINVPVDSVLDRLPSNRMREQVSEHLEGGSLFDVYNAITAAAQERSFESQYELEKWARGLLDEDWKEPHVHQVGEICPSCGRSF